MTVTTVASTIPETLLALTRDVRYTNVCKELILKILQNHSHLFDSFFVKECTLWNNNNQQQEGQQQQQQQQQNGIVNDTNNRSFNQRESNNENYENTNPNDQDTDGMFEQNHQLQQKQHPQYHPLLEPIADLMSSILYAVLVIRRLNRTYGMETCGLEYTSSLSSSSSSSSSLSSSSLSSSLSKPISSVLPSRGETKQNGNMNAFRDVVVACWIFTIRYVSYRFNASTNRTDDDENSNNNGIVANNESLTGAHRLNYFEQQRQKMINRGLTLDSATAAAENVQVTTTKSTLPPPPPPPPPSRPTSITTFNNNNTENLARYYSMDLYKRIRYVTCLVVHALARALSYDVLMTDGPHGIDPVPTQTTLSRTIRQTTVLNHVGMERLGTTNSTINVYNMDMDGDVVTRPDTNKKLQDIATSVFVWLLRFHFALYCLDGKYPTISHRLLYRSAGNTQKQNEPNGSSSNSKTTAPIIASSSSAITSTSRFVPYPTTIPKVIGSVLMIQSIITVLESITTYTIRALVDRNLSILSSSTSTSSSTTSASTSTNSAAFQKIPCFPIYRIAAATTSTTAATKATTSSNDNNNDIPKSRFNTSVDPLFSTGSGTTCAICHGQRRYPACPVSCGHVFCWYCLHRWITCNVQSCPLCRKPCTSKDVLALHNYYGATN